MKKENRSLLPFDKEIEKAVLGAMLSSQKAAYRVLEVVREDMFYEPLHRDIFKAIIKVVENKKAIDPVNVAEVLERQGILEKIGGIEYIAELPAFAINPAYIEDYIKTLTEKYLLRKTIEMCQETIRKCEKEEQEAEDILYELDKQIFDITQIKIREGLLPLKEILDTLFRDITRRDEEEALGIHSGYTKLDELTGGFHPGDFVVIASRPSVGKTSFVLNIMFRLAKTRNIPTALFSLEMSKLQIAQRFLILESQIESAKFRNISSLTDNELRRLLNAASNLENLPIFIDDTPKITVQELRAKARRAVMEHKVKIIFVDYIQLVQGPRFDTRQRELAYISASLKALAKELNVPVVALSQLSRKVEERRDEDAAPRLSDLRESGALEQDADIVIFLYKKAEEYERYEAEPFAENIIYFSVAKNRNGPQGKFGLSFIKEFMKFENLDLHVTPPSGGSDIPF